MARKVAWSNRSVVLLKEILDYWNYRNGSPNYSSKLNLLFQKSLEQLSVYPTTGGLTENIRIRYKKVRTYYIYYTFTESELNVVAISHVKRSPEYLDTIIDKI